MQEATYATLHNLDTSESSPSKLFLKKLEGRRGSAPTVLPFRRNSKLKKVLSNKQQREELIAYTRKENKEHLISLYEACKTYEMIKDKYARVQTACRIWQRYLKQGAECQVMLDPDLVQYMSYLDDDKTVLEDQLDKRTLADVKHAARDLLTSFNEKMTAQ
jgi:hypothetical protein